MVPAETVLAYLGHGRALEFYLGFLKLLIGISIITSNLDARTPPLADLAWLYSSTAIGMPFLVIGGLQWAGIVANLTGFRWSWVLRASAAVLAIALWSILLLKAGLVAEPTFVMPLALSGLPASAFLLYKALNRLPRPGALGMV